MPTLASKSVSVLRFGKGEPHGSVELAFVGMQTAFVMDVVAHDLSDRSTIGSCGMERADATAALD